MGEESTLETPINQQGQSAESTPLSTDEIADKFLIQRGQFRRHKTSLETTAIADAARVADKIAEAEVRKDLRETQERETRPNTSSEIRGQRPTNEMQPHPKKSLGLAELPTPPYTNETRNPLEEPKTFKQKLRDGAEKIAWNARLGVTMIAQLGGLHPWRSEGKWVWVLEAWARTWDDPRQSSYSNESDYYFKLFNSVNSRIINLESMGKASPSVTPDGFGGIQLLDHRRIHEARNAGKAVVVDVKNLHGLPKTFN